MRDKPYAQGGTPLTLEAANWRTPGASDGEGGVMEIRPGTTGHYKLRDDVANWPTPAARDHKGFDSPGKQNARQDPAMYLSSLLGQTMQRDGHTCSTSCRRLSPRFAEKLMGLPPGWVNSSEPLEMASFQAWRLELSRRSLYS